MTSAEKLHAIVAGLSVGKSTLVDAKTLGVTPPGFHSIAQTWAKYGRGPGFELVGVHADTQTGLYDRVRIRKTK